MKKKKSIKEEYMNTLHRTSSISATSSISGLVVTPHWFLRMATIDEKGDTQKNTTEELTNRLEWKNKERES